jgi:hypothetical protein
LEIFILVKIIIKDFSLSFELVVSPIFVSDFSESPYNFYTIDVIHKDLSVKFYRIKITKGKIRNLSKRKKEAGKISKGMHKSLRTPSNQTNIISKQFNVKSFSSSEMKIEIYRYYIMHYKARQATTRILPLLFFFKNLPSLISSPRRKE